eukprot:7381822-Prymnesium_polylepis.1
MKAAISLTFVQPLVDCARTRCREDLRSWQWCGFGVASSLPILMRRQTISWSPMKPHFSVKCGGLLERRHHVVAVALEAEEVAVLRELAEVELGLVKVAHVRERQLDVVLLLEGDQPRRRYLHT